MHEVTQLLVARDEYGSRMNETEIETMERAIDEAIVKAGYKDIGLVRQRLQMPIARIVKAHQAAHEHLLQLARDGL